MIEITLDKAREAARLAVAEKGEDYVYSNPWGESPIENAVVDCFYVHGRQPGCIVGNVLHRLGVPLEDLADHEGEGAWSLLDFMNRDGYALAAYSAVSYLTGLQQLQDSGRTWGEALKAAEGAN